MDYYIYMKTLEGGVLQDERTRTLSPLPGHEGHSVFVRPASLNSNGDPLGFWGRKWTMLLVAPSGGESGNGASVGAGGSRS